MSFTKDCPVRIALREGPQRKDHNDDKNVIKYGKYFENSVIVNDRVFYFDCVYGPQATQQQLYDSLLDSLVEKVLQGINCTVLAHGQTGTGKSYTLGLSKKRDEYLGMVPLCLLEFFKRADGEVSVSFIEIYNEKVFDLLASNSADPIFAKGHKVADSMQIPIKSLADFYELFERVTKFRHMRPTIINSMSSRSHIIFTVHLNFGERHSRLNIVDLAGSEGLRRTGHQGIAMSEAVHINQGLLCLNKVILAMVRGDKMIPYRDSALTSILQDSLNTSSYLTLLACVSPHAADLNETISTIQFAQNANLLKQNKMLFVNHFRCNSFCTPSKVRRIDYICNFSEMSPIIYTSTPAHDSCRMAYRPSLSLSEIQNWKL